MILPKSPVTLEGYGGKTMEERRKVWLEISTISEAELDAHTAHSLTKMANGGGQSPMALRQTMETLLPIRWCTGAPSKAGIECPRGAQCFLNVTLTTQHNGGKINLMTSKKGRLPVGWIVLATCALSLISWLPLIYSATNLGLKPFFAVTAFTPHQSIFVFAVFPFAIFATLIAAAIVILELSEAASIHPLVHWVSRNWPAIALLGILVASIVSLADYFGAPKSFDKFEPDAVETVLSCAQAGVETRCDVAAEYLKVSVQKGREIISPVAYLFIQIQVLISSAVAFVCLFVSVVYIASNYIPNLSLGPARSSLFFSLGLFAVYPLLFGLWRYEAARLSGSGVDNLGYIVAFALIIGIAILIFFTDNTSRGIASDVGQSIPLLAVLGSFVAIQFRGYEAFVPLLGSEANLATRVILLIAVVLFALILAGLLILQYEFRGATDNGKDAP